MRPRDTSPEAWKVQLDLIRRMTPAERLQRTLEWSALVRNMAESELRRRYPTASEREIFLRSARQRLGEELFLRAFGLKLAA